MDDDQAARVWVVPVGSGHAGAAPYRPASDAAPDILDRTERARAASFRREADRLRYRRAHTALRQILGAALGVAPADMVFGRYPCPRCGGPHGRPRLMTPPTTLQFSLAASEDMAMVALCPLPVGVDVERHADAETVALVGQLLHPAEQAEVRHAPPALRAQVFTSIWTRKEAYRKARGDGLAEDLAEDYLGIDAAHPAAPVDWQIISVPVDGPYQGAVAVRRAGQAPGHRQVRIRRWEGATP